MRRRRWSLRWVARFIAPWEGWRPDVYLDAGGIPTQGFGHTGDELTPGVSWTRAKGLRVLAKDIRYFAREVDRLVKVRLTVRERIAAISLAFNIGIGAFAESTFLKRLNAGHKRFASEALMWWVKDADGDTLLGLKRRRAAERWLFLHPTKGD